MHLRIHHRTRFTYAGEAHSSFNETRLRPIDDAAQQCHEYKLCLTPGASTRQYGDLYGNAVNYFEVSAPHSTLIIEAISRVETFPLAQRPPVPRVALAELESCDRREMFFEFYNSSPYVPLDVELWREAQDALAEGRADVWSDVRRMGTHVYRRFAYRPHSTGAHTLATDVLKLRMGVCQDFAHVHLGLCRSLGIPARYVSGYFFNTTRRPREQEASHAWIEAWLPGFGWAAYDPTHDRVPDERYVKMAVGRDYTDIRPVSGTYRGAPTRSLKVAVSVREISPRCTTVLTARTERHAAAPPPAPGNSAQPSSASS